MRSTVKLPVPSHTHPNICMASLGLIKGWGQTLTHLLLVPYLYVLHRPPKKMGTDTIFDFATHYHHHYTFIGL